MKWNKADLPYPDFQVAAWDNEETGETLVVEEELVDPRWKWRVLVLPANHDIDPEPKEVVDRTDDKNDAVEAAASYMGMA